MLTLLSTKIELYDRIERRYDHSNRIPFTQLFSMQSSLEEAYGAQLEASGHA